MEVASSAQAGPSNQQSDPSRPRQRRRPGRGRGNARGGENSALSFRPASIAPQANASTAAPTHNDDGQRSQRGRGRGRGGVRARGGRPAVESRRNVNGRTFGGQLTREETNASDASQGPANLQASAPVFVPGQQHAHNVTQPQPVQRQVRQPRQPKRRMSKSQAPDIATRTHEDIDNAHYECAICTSEVRRNSKVWSCHTCWTVFHMTCIKKWSSTAGAAFERAQDGEVSQLRQWRCPGCNLPKDDLPSSYTCWCAKESDPKSLAGIPPHSCGQTCGKDRARKCPHPCQLTCHAGPCPPCTHMGPMQSCFCGKHESTKRCFETDYTSGFSCGEVCGSLMPCGEHRCERPCHGGECGACDVRLPARCYCGQMEKDVLCSDRGEPKDSRRNHHVDEDEVVTESWTGVFNCGSTCNRAFDCGVHRREQICHPQVADGSHCPRSPDLVTHCSCGKTPLADLTSEARTSCLDSIPSCDKPCGKLLLCGHSCPEVCHTGNCPSCLQTITINCRCGRTTSKTICHQGIEEPPQCMRVCRANLNCGRHACEERCCAGESRAIARQASRKKSRPLNSASRSADDGFEAEHICTRQCSRLLKCGNHECEELCHKGPCGSCREAIFEEIACHCGRTVLQPPLPCGTKPPPCRLPCERPKACGHPQVGHTCHLDDAPCPKCPFLVEKRCMCGKKALKNQQCWLRDVGCGEICGKKLKCGVHSCRKICHRAGGCEDANGEACQQQCGKEKKICGHPDEAPCHAPFSCKEDKPCSSKIFITCTCQAQKQEIRCGASKSSDGNGGKSLPCNEECARLERNRKLAIALNIDQATHVEGADHVPYSTETLNLFAQHPKWCQTQEREFRVFASEEDEKRLRFKPMQSQQRAFVHALAEDFGLDSESVDPEPHRHVMIWKTPRFVSAPNKTLADALRIRQQAQRSANVSANVSDNEANPVKIKAKSFEPFNSFRITKPRFGLTIDEVRAEVSTILHPSTPFTFDIEFLPSEDVILKAVSRILPAQELEKMLDNLKMPLGTAIAAQNLGTVQLCTTDSSLNITRYESDGTTGDGWSRVAAKKSAAKMSLPSNRFGGINAFAALSGAGGKVTFAKKKAEKVLKPKPLPVAEDWEAAELAEEERERVASASEDEGGVQTSAPSAATDNESMTAVAGSVGEPDPAVPTERLDWAAQVESAL
ncbi:FKBP12-associated protein 1 [Fulvia fulva]|nr:FKBP12-associated protein 1 [Fulvia fulva]WPV19045.1 FKBP12-associated protein 1 [Fulvia fulva]WPV33915.1 FKBP12-associated protein 1 [Fulvia fulva]